MKGAGTTLGLGPGMGERQLPLPLAGGISLRGERAKASMARGLGKGLSWTRALPGELVGRTMDTGSQERGRGGPGTRAP